ncbi:MAG: sugar ABC transporter permease [Corynebacterium sp.]|uniref:carbohydrate ABC transporter permease n=1 Tax=Corynebacterium sp. TaxID=1720 RepID=UPI0026DFF373|nr:sugar ABC transporter permease [Corynebacterium sp.]MDO5670097.1 sugar ABC transporter permease [Corynebacterium sp.]
MRTATRPIPAIRRRRRSKTGFLFLLPALFIVSVLLIYPVASSFYYSFTDKHLIRRRYEFVGLDNYIEILTDPGFLHAFLVSINWTAASLLGQVVVGFTAALALNRINHFQGFFRTMLIIPWAFPSIVIALSWKWILNGVYGFVPNLIVKLGISDTPPQFFSNPNLVFSTLVFINIWFGAPLIMVNVLSALQTIPKDQYEAAQIDAATPWQSFLHITLPHIRVVVGLLVVLRTIWVFNNFDTIYLLTGGGPANLTETVPIYAYNVGWGLKQLGQSSAVTIVLLGFLLIICMFYFRLLDRWEKEIA